MKRVKMMDMDEQIFQELVTAYGGDARRWPDDKRAAMQAWQDSSAQARAIVSCAGALDDWLDARLPEAPTHLRDRITADMTQRLAATDSTIATASSALPQSGARHDRVQQTVYTLTAMAACLAIGIVNAPMLIDFIFGVPDPLTTLTMVGDEILMN